MIRHYTYRVTGTANGKPWELKGAVRCDWVLVMREIMVRTFAQLQKDKGLVGPFVIQSLYIDNVPMQGEKPN